MRKMSVPLSIDLLNDQSVGKYIELLKKAQTHRVFLCGFGTEYADLPENIEKRVDVCRKYKPLFEKEGIEVGAWISGFGHGGVLAHETEKEHKEYQKLMGPAGDIGGDSFCPLDPDFATAYLEYVGRVVAFHPDILMIDDDFRLSVRGYGLGCFCPLHMAKMQEKLGTEISREELADRILSGEASEFRDAFLAVMGETLLDFAQKIRDKVDETDKKIRLGVAMCFDTWDCDGTDGIALAKVFAGETEPFLRTIGAPYWAALETGNGDIISVAEYTRMQMAWCKGLGIECTSEGDVYPRPRYNVPARYLELFDMILTASGESDYILKYMFDYTRRLDYEQGYVDRHIRNMSKRAELAELFENKQAQGVYVYEAMHKMRNYDLTDVPKDPVNMLLHSLFGRAQYLLAHNGIPTFYGNATEKGTEQMSCAVAAFGENARTLPAEYLDQGVITDCIGAKILTERGFDVGYQNSSYETFQKEYFPGADDTISFHSVVTCRMECKDDAEVCSTFQPQGIPASYRYENAQGQRFFVLAYDSYSTPVFIKTADYIVNYHRQQQLAEMVEWLGRKPLPAVTAKHPYLYTLSAASADAKSLSVGLFNGFADEVSDCEITMDKEYRQIRFVNCTGKINGNIVTLEGEIGPMDFAAFEVW